MKHPKPYIPYSKDLISKARENRKNPTPAEKRMWFEVLSRKSFQNLKFTRQKPLDCFIVDFYCSKLLLVIEIDGDSHARQEAYDHQRTRRLEALGLTVIRYTNRDVMQNIEGVYLDLMGHVDVLRRGRGEV